MAKETGTVNKRLRAYRRKFYQNELLKGVLVSLLFLLLFYIGAVTLDFTFRFGGLIRAFLFFGFLGLSIWLGVKRIIIPILHLVGILKGLDDLESARQVGGFFPEVRDKLLNLLQLQRLADGSSLAKASVEQKSAELGQVEFTRAVSYKSNGKYAKYLSIPALILMVVLLFSPQLFTTSTPRIINFTEDYLPIAPFSFVVNKTEMTAFRNEDFSISLTLEGDAFPEDVYLVHKDLKYKMQRSAAGFFTFTFEKIQSDKKIYFDASGFNSEEYLIRVVQRPNLKSFNIELDYPAYTGKRDERISNIGNLEIPEGTDVQWLFDAINTAEMKVAFGNDTAISLASEANLFRLSKKFYRDTQYKIVLENEFTSSKDPIIYTIQVQKDQYPSIVAGSMEDTLTYRSVNLAGNISDDYGISRLQLKYHIQDTKDTIAVNLPIDKSQLSQGFFYQWSLDSLELPQGGEMRYYIQVSDNDRVNGSKSSKSATYVFNLPDKKEIQAEIDKAGDKAESKMEDLVERARELEDMIEELQERLKSKPDMNWQDEQLLKELLKEREAIEEEIKKLSEEFKDLKKQREQFTDQKQETKDKTDQLDKLIEDMMDEETREMYEELKKMLEEKYNKNEVEQQVNDLKNRQKDLSNDLERTMELFKRLKLEQKLEEAIQDLDELAEEQNKLAEETEQSEKSTEELSKEQESINKDFQEFQEKMEQIEEMNQDLKNPEPMKDISDENQGIEELQEQIKQDLKEGDKKDAQEKQNRSSQKMKQLSQQMEQMQAGMEMMMMQENLDNLREILNNLVKLSFDQEDLMIEFREVKQSDPRFIELAQEQLKLKDDAKIIEDSLMSLASRVQQISSFATKEVTEMNRNLESSIQAIRDRKKPVAVSNQQLAMTSINNLALMLDNTLSDMMNVMADAMGMSKGQPKNGQEQSLGEMQMQLNNQMEQLQQSGKSGRELSEELAKLAAEQERIRRALQEMQEKYGQDGSAPGGNDIPKKMEQTEMDLVNKRITQQTIRRQKDILTRLLQAEDAMRERDLDDEREGETAQDQYENEMPKAFEDYFKSKQKEIELLKTVPPRLYPYYKKEVNEYFERLREK